MDSLAEMIARHARDGSLDWIGLRPARHAAMREAATGVLEPTGLAGDHGRAGKRAVTLIQGEHLAAIGSYLGRDSVPPALLRRNLVISGLNLAGMKGREIAVGTARLRITVMCAPCSRMEATFGPGGYAAVRGHGGWCALVVRPGVIRIGDPVRPVD